MSHEDTKCPCGEKKDAGVMLCQACQTAFADRSEMAAYQDTKAAVEYRRHAAVILVNLARRRTLPP